MFRHLAYTKKRNNGNKQLLENILKHLIKLQDRDEYLEVPYAPQSKQLKKDINKIKGLLK